MQRKLTRDELPIGHGYLSRDEFDDLLENLELEILRFGIPCLELVPADEHHNRPDYTKGDEIAVLQMSTNRASTETDEKLRCQLGQSGKMVLIMASRIPERL